MRLLVAAIVFGVTIGGLFLIENYKNAPKEENFAQIVQNLQNQSPSKTPTLKPVNKSSETTTKTFTPSPVPSLSLAMTPTAIPLLTSLIPSPTPNPTAVFILTIAPASTPSPTTAAPAESNQSTPTPATGHIFYTSSYATAKYYYCDTDDGWKTLSAKYLKSYPSPEALLKDYPSRTLHEFCK